MGNSADLKELIKLWDGQVLLQTGNKKIFKCRICGNEFIGSIWKVYDHIDVHHTPGIRHSCPLCPYLGTTQTYLKRHLRRRHRVFSSGQRIRTILSLPTSSALIFPGVGQLQPDGDLELEELQPPVLEREELLPAAGGAAGLPPPVLTRYQWFDRMDCQE